MGAHSNDRHERVGAALVLAAPVLGLFGTIMAGLTRVMFDIGRSERTADLRDDLASIASDAVARAAERHVLRHEIWLDEAARRKTWKSVLTEHAAPPLSGWESWTIQSFVEDGEAKVNVTSREAGVWLEVGGKLLTSRDDFAAAIGPYMADLGPETRRLTTSVLSGLEDAKRNADQVFLMVYKPDGHTDVEVISAGHDLYESIRFVYSAARRLGAWNRD